MIPNFIIFCALFVALASGCAVQKVMKDCHPMNPNDPELAEFSVCKEQYSIWR